MSEDGRTEDHTTEPSSPSDPKDRFGLVYIAFFLAGAGFLFPWNSFVAAVDYFLFLYPDKHPEVAIAVMYLVVTLTFSTVNVCTVHHIPLHARIGFGYVMFTAALVFVPLLDIAIQNCALNLNVSFVLTLCAVLTVGVGSGMQQSSYYGLSGMLPPRYTQAVMAGESAAGIVVSFNRVVTKLAVTELRSGVIAFFVLSVLFILMCVGCQVYIARSAFVRHYVTACSQKRAPAQQGEEDNQSLLTEQEKELDTTTPMTVRFREMVLVRWRVTKQIWMHAAAILIAFFFTLFLFPGIISEIQYCNIKDWMPVILITIFNLCDFIAKWLALVPIKWMTPKVVLLSSIGRVIFIPLFLLCTSPSPTYPVLTGPAWPIIITFAFGLTNGYLGCLPMVAHSKYVTEHKHKELAGTIMTWFLLTGLTLGAILAYSLTPLTRLREYRPCLNATQESICAQTNNRTLLST